MALISIAPDFGDGGQLALPNKRNYTLKYVARSNNRFDTILSVARDRLCPQLKSRCPFDPGAYVVSVDPTRRDQTLTVWDIAVGFSTELDEEEENPLEERAKITLKSDQFTRTTTKNSQGRNITTTAGSLIPVSIDDSNWVLSVTKNVRSIPLWLLDMNNKVNSGSVIIRGLPIPRRKLQIKGIVGSDESTRVNGERIDYVALSFELHYKRDGYKVRLPNVDFVQIVENKIRAKRDRFTGKPLLVNGLAQFETVRERVPILIGEPGEKPSEPWPLDRDGKALPENYSPNQVLYIEEDVLEETSFANLPLN